MITINDVASKAGVSVATVSRVLNNRGPISEKTRKTVNQAMKELDYQPNEIARSLSKQHSKIIGLILPSVAHEFYGELAYYIETYAYKNGYKLMLCNSFYDKDKEKSYVDMLSGNKVDGIIVGSHTKDVSHFIGISLPLLSIERVLSDNIPAILSNNYQGGVIAARHLISKGCKKLIHISGDLSMQLYSDNRYKGFADVCEKEKVEYKLYQATEEMLVSLDYSKLVAAILYECPDVDGIFASSDIIAAQIIKTCAVYGINIPRDIKVVGFDGIKLSDLINPPITTIKQDIEEIANKAIGVMLELINRNTVENETIIPVSLIERRTT